MRWPLGIQDIHSSAFDRSDVNLRTLVICVPDDLRPTIFRGVEHYFSGYKRSFDDSVGFPLLDLVMDDIEIVAQIDVVRSVARLVVHYLSVAHDRARLSNRMLS
jgi:hypothetical protein